MLAAALVDRDALEDQVVVVAWGDRAGLEDRVLDAVLGHAALDQLHAHVHRHMRLDPHARMYHIDEDGDRVMLLDDDDLATAMDHVHRHPDPHLLLVIE